MATLEVALSMKKAWSFSGCSQWIGNLAHIPSCSLGSYYPISVELSSPKLCAYKSKPGPRLIIQLFHSHNLCKQCYNKFKFIVTLLT